MTPTDTPRTDAVQCEAGILSANRCTNPATFETSTGYKCCEYHTPQITKGKNRDDVKPLTTTDTPRTDACPYCGATDDCMCFSEELKQALAASQAEVERLKAIIDQGDFVPSTHYHNRSFQAGVDQAKWAAQDEWYGKYKKERTLLEELYGKQKEELSASKAEVERLRAILKDHATFLRKNGFDFHANTLDPK